MSEFITDFIDDFEDFSGDELFQSIATKPLKANLDEQHKIVDAQPTLQTSLIQ